MKKKNEVEGKSSLVKKIKWKEKIMEELMKDFEGVVEEIRAAWIEKNYYGMSRSMNKLIFIAKWIADESSAIDKLIGDYDLIIWSRKLRKWLEKKRQKQS